MSPDPLSTDAGSRLIARVDGSPLEQPLEPWRILYFIRSRRWRRARAAREELSRAQVAKEVGVTESLLEAWEVAAIRTSETPLGD